MPIDEEEVPLVEPGWWLFCGRDTRFRLVFARFWVDARRVARIGLAHDDEPVCVRAPSYNEQVFDNCVLGMLLDREDIGFGPEVTSFQRFALWREFRKRGYNLAPPRKKKRRKR